MATKFSILFTEHKILNDEVNQCSELLSSRKLELSNLIIDLQPLITSQETSIRTLGIEFISKCICKLPLDFFNEDECEVLATFLVQKLSDFYMIQPHVLRCFLSLIKIQGRNSMSQKTFSFILLNMLKQIYVQSMPNEEKSLLYDTIAWCLENKLEIIKLNSSDFIEHFINAIEEETNPKNLLVIFSCWPIIINHLDCQEFYNEIFEAISCYFPIDYAGNKKLSSRISRKDLADGLHNCLAATSKFSNWAIPMFIEKLSSDLVDAKIDSLDCFKLCVKTYSANNLKPHLNDIWTRCQLEILGIRTNKNFQIIDKSLDLVGEISRKLSEEIQTSKNREILTNWNSLIWQEVQPVLKFIESSLMETAIQILCKLISLNESLSEHWLNKSIPVLIEMFYPSDDKAGIVASIGNLLNSSYKLNSSPEWSTQLFTILEMGYSSTNFEWRSKSHQALINASKKLSHPMFKDELEECFKKSSKPDSKLLNDDGLVDLVLTILEFNKKIIEDWAQSILSDVKSISYRDLRVIIAACAKYNHFDETYLPLLVSNFNGMDEESLKITLHMLYEMFNHIDIKRCQELESKLKLIECLKDLTSNVDQRNKLLSTLVAKSDKDRLKNIVDIWCLEFINEGKNDNVIRSIVCSLPLETIKNSKVLLNDLFEVNSNQNLELLQGSILNKSLTLNETMVKFLEKILSDDELLEGFHWIAQGLLYNGSKHAGTALKKLLNHIQTTNDNQTYIDHLLKMIKDNEFYTIENHHYKVKFYKQKFFNLTYPTLLEWFNEGNKNALDIILLQLPELPESIVKQEIEPILHQLCRSVFNNEDSYLSKATSSFLTFLKTLDESMLKDISDSMFSFLLRVAQNDQEEISNKISALNVLQTLANEKCDKILKNSLIKQLKPLIDNKKRLIREAASETRNSWMCV